MAAFKEHEKLVEFFTANITTELAASNEENVLLRLPLIDFYSFRIFSEKPIIQYRTKLMLETSFRKNGYCGQKLNHSRSKTELHFRDLKKGNYFFCMRTSGNGIKYLREKYEPETIKCPPISLDGNSNIFLNHKMYFRFNEFLPEQIMFLESLSFAAVEALNETSLNTGFDIKQRGNIKITFDNIEFCFHELVPIDEVLTYVTKMQRKISLMYPNDVSIEIVSPKTSKIKSIRSRLKDVWEVVCYLKDDGKNNAVVRFEVRFKKEFFKKKYKNRHLLKDVSNIKLILNDLAIEAWKMIAPFLKQSENQITKVTFTEAYETFIKNCSKKTAHQVLARLREGDGFIYIKSNQGAIYRCVNGLVKMGFLVKSKPGVLGYVINPKYSALLNGEGITERIMRECDQYT